MSDNTYHKVGRRPWELKGQPDGLAERKRSRVPYTRRHWLKWRDSHNLKTLQRERVLADKKPLWWTIGLGALLVITPFLPNSMISVASIFCIYAAINVLWTLIVGTAGIFSLATLAVVGVSGYMAAAANVYLGVPWPFMLIIGLVVGFIAGAVLAAPSTRLDGLYYALLTMGVAEICRVFVVQLRALTVNNGACDHTSRQFYSRRLVFTTIRAVAWLWRRVLFAVGRSAGLASGQFRAAWILRHWALSVHFMRCTTDQFHRLFFHSTKCCCCSR